VVAGAFKRVTAAGTVTKKYFDGTKPPGSTNFLDEANGAALRSLVKSLVEFFGVALGCTDGTIAKYTGPSMSKVHQPMTINTKEFSFFNTEVVAVMAVAGVTPADQGTVRSLLNGLNTDIVTICNRYADALKITNLKLMTNVVTATFGRITRPSSPILKFFNGVQPPGSIDYVNKNKDQLPALVDGLNTFFGAALGCGDGTVGKYTGPKIKTVHEKMGIKFSEFSFFNIQLLQVLKTSGVSFNDLRAVDKVLNNTRDDIITA